jgi:hypothetical protein
MASPARLAFEILKQMSSVPLGPNHESFNQGFDEGILKNPDNAKRAFFEKRRLG